MDENPMHETNVEEPTITIENHIYNPTELNAKDGQMVKIINNDEDEHTVTAENGEFDVEIMPSQYEELIVNKKGTFRFYCRYHPNMKGILIVE